MNMLHTSICIFIIVDYDNWYQQFGIWSKILNTIELSIGDIKEYYSLIN
jgi:hypothetical protein